MLKDICDCKVVVGENVVRQYRIVVCSVILVVRKMKRIKIEYRINWWKLVVCFNFREELRQVLGGYEVFLDDWIIIVNVIREIGRRVFVVYLEGKYIDLDKQIWCWNEEVQVYIQRKGLVKKKWDIERIEESRQEYREMQCKVNFVILVQCLLVE